MPSFLPTIATLRKSKNLLTIECTPTKTGFLYVIEISQPNGRRKAVTFPVQEMILPPHQLVRQSALQQFAALEEVWIDGYLEERENSYLLPYDRIASLPKALRQALAIPPQSEVDTEIQSFGAVGSSDFRLKVRVFHPEKGQLPLDKRLGQAIQTADGELILLSQDTAKLLDRIDDKPVTIKDQFPYIAEVKALAEDANASIDTYLRKEEYYFPRELDIDVSTEKPDSLILQPKLLDLPKELHDASLFDTSYLSSRLPTGKRQRVFLPKQVQEKVAKIKEIGPLQGQQVPQFIQNPAAFLPEDLDIDLDKFSDRVKGLGIRVYQARPYVRAEKTKNNWFKFQAGVELESITEDQTETEANSNLDIPADSLHQLLPDKSNAGWQYIDGQWIHLPPGTDKLLHAAQELKYHAPDGKISATYLPYFLDIYTNIENLEYNAEFARLREEFLGISNDPEDSHPPGCFQGQLYSYQTEGYKWLKRLHRISMGGLLADEMGLGKTVQVIAFLAWLAEIGELRPSLIVVPKALLQNWKSELQKFFPQATISIHIGSNRTKCLKDLKAFDLTITTYDTLVRDELLLGQVRWSVMACDEAQKMKNYTTATARVCKAMQARVRLAITGTPVENSLGDLWSIVDFAQPGLLGSYREFRKKYEHPLTGDANTNLHEQIERELFARLSLVYKRRTKDEFVTDIPGKEEEVHWVQFTGEQRRLYNQVLNQLRTEGKRQALTAIHKLLDICTHPYLVTGEIDSAKTTKLIDASPKIRKTLEILKKVQLQGEKAIIFTSRHKLQFALQKVILDKLGIRPQIINGTTSKRLEVVENFNRSSGFNILILSPRAAGVGLTITGANHVIHFTRWWNPAVENQATDRVHRIGQKKQVYIYLLVAKDTKTPGQTADEILHELLNRKRTLAKNIVVPSNQLKVSQEDILNILAS